MRAALSTLLAAATFWGCDSPTDVGGRSPVPAGSIAVVLTSGRALSGSATSPLLIPMNAGSVPVSLDDVEAIHVTVTGVEVLPSSGSAWEALEVTPEDGVTTDLLDLTATAVVLARDDLPAGEYVNARLFIEGATITFSDGVCLGPESAGAGAMQVCLDGGEPHEVVLIPSAQQTGIKTDAQFMIAEGSTETTVTLVFDAQATIRTIAWAPGLGKMVLAPVIRATDSGDMD